MKLIKVSFLMVACLLVVFFIITSCAGNPITPNTPPKAPSNPIPSNDATNVSITSLLSWTCTDPDGDSLAFDIYFGTSSNPPLVTCKTKSHEQYIYSRVTELQHKVLLEDSSERRKRWTNFKSSVELHDRVNTKHST